VTAVRRLLAGGLLVALAGCTAGNETAAAAAGDGSSELTIFAAASLTDAFEALGAAFAADNPDISMTFNFAGSQTLASQIVAGAPADVFAAANEAQMEVVADAGLLAEPARAFASNRLAIAVEPGNPQGIAGLADLGRADLKVVLAADEVPAGQYARAALDAAGVTVQPVSLETDVRAVLTKVGMGEADAGIVYRSDVATARGRVASVEIPADQNVVATYPIAVVSDGPNPAAAHAFVAYVESQEGRKILSEFGFSPP
jgi:molybdate transport system substrate-binding protein